MPYYENVVSSAGSSPLIKLNRVTAGLRQPSLSKESLTNLAFAQDYEKQNGLAPTVDLSNGGSSKQAQAN